MSSAAVAPGRTFSSMNTSLRKPLIRLELKGAYDLDHRTTPEVVKISNPSSMAASSGGEEDYLMDRDIPPAKARARRLAGIDFWEQLDNNQQTPFATV